MLRNINLSNIIIITDTKVLYNKQYRKKINFVENNKID
jgi:hypothetical protein